MSVRDLWLTKREAVRIDKIKKSLIISADSFDCGPINKSIQLGNTVGPLRTGDAGVLPLTLSATTITLDFWYYAIPTNAVSEWSIIELLQTSSYGIRVLYTQTNVKIEIITSSATYTITIPGYWYQWRRYTIAVSTSSNLGKLYIDGILVGSVAVAAGSFSTTAFDMWVGESFNLSYANGYIQDIAIYSVYKDENAVAVLGTHKGIVGTYSGNLAHYWKLRENLTASVGGDDLLGEGMLNGPTYSTEQYAPIKYGASFIAAQYEISLDYKLSFSYPNTIPDSCTGMLVVRWIDDNDVVQRRRFWDLAGVDINPMPAIYLGEAVSEDFVLEWWNIDGQATVELVEDLTLRISKTTNPTTSYDTTAVEAATLTVRTTLAEEFPFTPFPLTFESQQTY